MKSAPLIGLVIRFASRLRFPTLFLVTAALFVIDMIVPDFIPFADEVLLALATLVLGTWQRNRTADKPLESTEPHRAAHGKHGSARSI